jgi:ADP-ribose pyrophosphatase
MDGYHKLSSKYVYHGHNIRLRVDGVRLPSGKVTTREVVEHDGAVAIIAIDPENKLLLVKQFRHAADKDLLEIPAGGIDVGETPEQTALREMQEETGLMPGKLEKLCGFYAAPGYASEFLHVFLATELKPARLVAEDTDEIELIRKPLDEAIEMIRTGEIQDAKSIAGILFYARFRDGKPV